MTQIRDLILFAAGLGTRMKPLTNTKPKPLVEVAGKSLLWRNLEFATVSGIFERIFINGHYLHEQVEEEIARFIEEKKPRSEIIFVYEPELLETAGAVKNIASKFEIAGPVFTQNSDSLFFTENNIYKEMSQKWQALNSDFLLLLHQRETAYGYVGSGEFFIDENNALTRSSSNSVLAPYVFTGLQILKPSIIAQIEEEAFSLSHFYNHPQHLKLCGHIYHDIWTHVSCPEDIPCAESFVH